MQKKSTLTPLLDRMADKFTVGDDCWHWTASKSSHGYGQIREGARGSRLLLAHRVMYEFMVGPIPEGLDIDHQCHNQDPTCPGGDACVHRSCIRPDHLIPATRSENLGRGQTGKNQRDKTHCPKGHEYNEENTYWRMNRAQPIRECKICRAESAAKQQAKKRGK